MLNLHNVVHGLSRIINQSRRQLTSTQLTTALKPFYFAVHPDLFGQYPRERQNNEESLQRLSAYIQSVYSNDSTSPTQLVFYLRPTSQQHDGLRKVSLSLLSQDPHTLVTQILKQCQLSTAGVPPRTSQNTDKQSGKVDVNRPIRWHHSYYYYTGQPDPEARPEKPPLTLSVWLDENEDTAHARLATTLSVQQENQRLIERLRELYGIPTVYWSTDWESGSFTACLRTLDRICSEKPRLATALTGRVVHFGYQTGIDLLGNLELCTKAVPQSWISFLQTIESADVLERRMSAVNRLEMRVGRLLRGARVIRRQTPPLPLLTTYSQRLMSLGSSLMEAISVHHLPTDDECQDISVLVVGESGPAVDSQGRFVLPSSCPGVLAHRYLEQNRQTALDNALTYLRRREEADSLVMSTRNSLSLLWLELDPSLTLQQIISCCSDLSHVDVSTALKLQGLGLRIAHHYSVSKNGTLCIPWNWSQ